MWTITEPKSSSIQPDSGVPSTLVTVKGSSHERIILELSREDKTAGPAILKFVRETACPR